MVASPFQCIFSVWILSTHKHLLQPRSAPSSRVQEFKSSGPGTMNLVVFGWTLTAILSQFGSCPRDLDALELFSGVESLVYAGSSLGLACKPFDKFRLPGKTDTTEDLTTETGFLNAARLVCHLRVGGLLWMAPVCSSWVFWNISRTKRSKANNFTGDTTYEPVRLGNTMAQVCAFLIELAAVRCAQVAVENPPRSFIWEYQPFSSTVDRLCKEVCTAARCAYEDAPKGKRLQKDYKFKASGSWIHGAAATCPCGCQPHRRLSKRWKNAQGKIRSKGKTDALKESASYPRKLGHAIMQSYLQHRLSSAEEKGKSSSQVAGAARSQGKDKRSWQDLTVACSHSQGLRSQMPAAVSHQEKCTASWQLLAISSTTASKTKDLQLKKKDWSWTKPEICSHKRRKTGMVPVKCEHP